MPPVNDNLANATVLSGSSVSLGGTLVGSTLEDGPWTLEGGWTERTYWSAATVNDGRSAIYKKTQAADELLNFQIAGSGFNPYVEIYRDLGPGIDMEFTDWFGDGTASPPSKPIALSAGETYYIFVWNWEFDTSEGSFTLESSVAITPPNDNIINAITIGTDQIVSGSTQLATTEPGESTYGTQLVWYKWKGPGGVTAQLTKLTDDVGFSSIYIYESDVGPDADYGDLGSLAALVGSQPPPRSTQWTTQPIWYYIAVDPPSDTGDFTFQITVFNEADAHNGGVFLSTQPNGWHVSNNVGATTEVGEQVHAGVGTHHSVWLYFRGNHIGEYTFNIERVWGDLENPVIAVYRNPFSAFGSMVEIASDATTPLPSVTFTLDPSDENDQIAIVIAGRAQGQEGGFVLNWEFHDPVQTGNIADAVPISGTGSLTNLNLDGSMVELGNYFIEGFNFGDGIHWYKAEPTSDGSLIVTITADLLNSQYFFIWKGADPDTQICLAKKTFSSGSATKILNVPVEAGETYYVMFKGVPQVQYDISWELNTEVPIDIQPDDIGDFDTNNGASFSGGELVCGPNDYVQHTILPSGHARASDPVYIGFGIRYGNANRMLYGSGDLSIPVLEVYAADNSLLARVIIGESADNTESTGNLAIAGASGGSIYRLSEDTIYCEIIVDQAPSEDYTATAKGVSGLVQGSDMMPGSSDSIPASPVSYIKLGYINEPSSAPNLDLRITDIRIKTLYGDEGFPDPPFYTDPSDRLCAATGFTEGEFGTNSAHVGTGLRNTQTITAFDVIDDPTGGGRGKVINSSAAARTASIPGTQIGIRSQSISIGWWSYFTTIGNGGFIALVTGSDYGTLNQSFVGIAIEFGGGIYVQIPGFVSSIDRTYAHRKMTTGSWHHIELEVTKIIPRVEGRWWIDGEEQAPFVQDRGMGRIWGYIGGASISMSSNLRGYFTDLTYSLKGPIGPTKSTMIVPDASGTHELGVLVNYTEGPGEEKIITSTNDGTTYTPLGATDPVHTFIDEWPNNDSTTTSDMIGQANRDSWIEYTYQNVTGEVKLVNAFTAVRAMHIVHGDFTGLHSYPDLQPHSRDQSDWGAMTSQNKFLLGDNEVNRSNHYDSGFDTNYKLSQAAMGHAPDRELWTDTKLNSLVARWGYAHYWGSVQQGNALEAQMMEVIMGDDPGSTLDVFTPPEPRIDFIAQQTDEFNPPFELTSCDAWQPTDKRTDPNMARKIWLFPSFEPDWDVFKVYWRMTPAYDPTSPGFDGVYTHTGLERQIWTDGEFFSFITNRSEIYAERWGNNYYDGNFNFASSEMRVMSPSLLYNPCSLGDLVDEDGNITFEAFVRDEYGVDSTVATLVVNITRGLCCGGAIVFNKIVALR